MSEERESTEVGLWERVLRSRAVRGLIRIHAGGSLVRSWSADAQIPRGSSVHLFDYLLYRRSDTDQPFEAWLETRELWPP